jgi:hypothetical protein
MPQITRTMKSFLNASSYFYEDNEKKIKELSIGNTIVNLDLQIANYEEKIYPSSLIELILTFKENTMIIYESLLADKRIMFIGEANTSCEKLTSYIFSLASMLSPPVVGLIKRLHPYKNLYDLEFLKTTNCVFGVTNPIFKNKTDSWDIMCEVETGKITVNEKFKQYLNAINRETDIFFIKELIYKIKSEFINEYEVERYFRLYTRHLLKISSEEFFTDDDELVNEINRQYKRKLKLQNSFIWKMENSLEKLYENMLSNNKSFKSIIHHLHELYYRKNIDKEELIVIYSDIEKFMTNELFVSMVIIFNLY